MSLQTAAILVALSTPKFGLNRADEDEAKAVASKHHAEAKSVTVTKRILQGNPSFDAIRKFDGQLGIYNRKMTLPWDDNGTRMLPTLQYDEYMAYMRKARTDRDELVRVFLAGYDSFVQADRQKLGTLFRSSDYPNRWLVRDRFAFALDVQPVPDGKDFRIAVGKIERAEMEKNVENRVKQAEERARTDLMQRLAEPLWKMVERLDTDNKVTLTTTVPLIENLREVLDLIPRLNIVGDPKIEEFRRAALEKLAHITPQTLKESDLVRSVAVRQAQAIIDDMADFMGGPTPSAIAA
jgi:hypothetical protein